MAVRKVTDPRVQTFLNAYVRAHTPEVNGNSRDADDRRLRLFLRATCGLTPAQVRRAYAKRFPAAAPIPAKPSVTRWMYYALGLRWGMPYRTLIATRRKSDPYTPTRLRYPTFWRDLESFYRRRQSRRAA